MESWSKPCGSVSKWHCCFRSITDVRWGLRTGFEEEHGATRVGKPGEPECRCMSKLPLHIVLSKWVINSFSEIQVKSKSYPAIPTHHHINSNSSFNVIFSTYSNYSVIPLVLPQLLPGRDCKHHILYPVKPITMQMSGMSPLLQPC